MKVTKYPQSTLILEKEGRRILIDPGSFTAAKYSADDFAEIEAIVLTHRHPDHVDEGLIKSILNKKNVPVVGNTDTKEAFPELITDIISDSETIIHAGFTIKAHDLPHVPMVDGSAGPQNTGYIIDDNFFHAGDGVDTTGVDVHYAAVPIAGPDLSLRDAHNLIKSIGAKVIIPIHYSLFTDEKPTAAIGLIQKFTPEIDELRVLANGESTLI